MTPEQQFFMAMATLISTTILSLVATIVGVRQSRSNATKLDQVHVLVNSNMTALRDELHTTRAALQAGGIADPTRPPPTTP